MKTRISLPLVLPEVDDERDACVERVTALLGGENGIARVHIAKGDDGKLEFCIHFEPSVITLNRVIEIAKAGGAKVSALYGHAVFPLRALDGEDATTRIERAVKGIPGVLSSSVNMAAQLIRVEWEKKATTKEAIAEFLHKARYATAAKTKDGHSCCAHNHKEDDDHKTHWYERNKELAWSLCSGILLVIAWGGERSEILPHWGAVIVYLAAYGLGAYDLLSHFLKSLSKGKFTFDIDLLMLLAAIGSAILGAWVEGALLLFLFSFAHALEHYALGKARGAIKALAELAPTKARVLKDSKETEIPIEQVKVGDIVVVRPGERIPVDGTINSGKSAVNQAPITGESIPVDKDKGAEVFAGTINGEGALEISTTKASGDRTLDRVIKLVEEAQTQKAPTQLFTERFERVFVPVVLVADFLLIVIPPLIGFWPWATSFYRGMALLVAASPCALALGTPSAVLAGIAQAARRGVLIKGGAYLEDLGSLKAIAFDKTGTLTVGKPEVTDVVPREGLSETELLRLAGAVEKRSQHPLAEAVVRRAEESKITLPEAGDLESVTGRGVKSTVEGKQISIGSLKLWEKELAPQAIQDAVKRLQENGRSVMVVRSDEDWLGVLGLADKPRENVKAILQKLRDLGIKPLIMLTGDNQGVGRAIGKEVGVDEVQADLMPEDKVKAIQTLLSQHTKVAMIGDGVNDAPALAHATVGIAMGGAGTAVALETADVALMSDDLSKLPFAIGLSRQARTIIKQNLYLSLSVIGVLIITTTTGFLGIAPAVAIHEGSTLVVIANSLRLLAFNG